MTEPREALGTAALPEGEAWAAGYSTNETGGTRTGVLLHCVAGAWQAVAMPAVSANWYLESVSFPMANEGWAAGVDLANGRGVVLHYKDGAWAVDAIPAPDSGNWTLSGVSMASATSGWAIGYDNERATMLLYEYAP
ncbi:MAG: hypothetical protein KA184_06420 [Candidatus Hydrogenedentes bacterium]|nr:hypothetical protein [Candidatus Hydrogenedentota bacterium]